MSATRVRGKKGRWESTVRRYNVWSDESLLLHLFVPGEPKPWCVPKMARFGGEIPTPPREAMKHWQARVHDEFGRQYVQGRRYQFPLDGPLAARLVFYLPRPGSRKKSEVWAETYADLDNMVKACLDALQQVGAVVNDSRIVELHAAKVWTPKTGPNALPRGVRIELRRPPADLSKTHCLNVEVECPG